MSPPTPDPPHPPLHFSDAQIAQWRRGWKVLLRFRTKKKATDPLNEEQRQRNLQKGREALQRFRDKQHAMVSTAPGLPRRVDAVTAPALLTPPPVRRCQSPALVGSETVAEAAAPLASTTPCARNTASFTAMDELWEQARLELEDMLATSPVKGPADSGAFYSPSNQICATPPCDATPWSLCAPPGSPESPVTRAAEAQILLETLVDPPPHARISRVLDGAKADIFWYVLHRTLLRWNATTTVSTISLPTLLNPRRLAASMRTPTPSLPLLNPIASCDSRQDEDGVCGDPTRPLNQKSKRSIEGEPGHQPDLHQLLLQPTLLNPRRLVASVRTPTPSLPLLNPIASCDSRQDEDGVCVDPTRPLNQKSKSAWRRKKRLAQRQADKQRSEPAFWTDSKRSLWMHVRAHVMMVDASNHSGWDPGRDFWRSLRHREEAPPDGLSACETFRACPDCGGVVGVVEDAPSDASSDVDLPPLGGTSGDDYSD